MNIQIPNYVIYRDGSCGCAPSLSLSSAMPCWRAEHTRKSRVPNLEDWRLTATHCCVNHYHHEYSVASCQMSFHVMSFIFLRHRPVYLLHPLATFSLIRHMSVLCRSTRINAPPFWLLYSGCQTNVRTWSVLLFADVIVSATNFKAGMTPYETWAFSWQGDMTT